MNLFLTVSLIVRSAFAVDFVTKLSRSKSVEEVERVQRSYDRAKIDQSRCKWEKREGLFPIGCYRLAAILFENGVIEKSDYDGRIELLNKYCASNLQDPNTYPVHEIRSLKEASISCYQNYDAQKAILRYKNAEIWPEI